MLRAFSVGQRENLKVRVSGESVILLFCENGGWELSAMGKEKEGTLLLGNKIL